MHSHKIFWKQVDEINARELVVSVIGAAKTQVDYSRAANASKLAAILLGQEAGRRHQLEAELKYKRRNSQLQQTKQWLTKLAEGVDEKQKSRFAEFCSRNALTELADYARQRAVMVLLDSETAPADARRAVDQLNSRLEELDNLKTLQEVNDYLQRHLDVLIQKEIGNPDPDPLCVLVLLLTSVYLMLIVIAAIVCALSFGLACEDIMDSLLEQTCSSWVEAKT
jgi:hypothetical protein